MEKITKKFKKFLKYFNFLIKKILFKHKDKTNNIFTSKINLKISNFNKSLIASISLLFIYLFYLSIPSLYNKTWVQNTIEDKLLDDFKINFSTSSTITYKILPSPHFSVENVKILNNDSGSLKVISEIKQLNIFISQKNFFNKDKLKIRKISINEANFYVQKKDFNFFDNLLKKKFSQKK